ncbi:MAG TPA: hypothetical protein VGR65_03910 [Casimicrobiaceae bacterium]|jgi:hypothetical protein|nr:hypothetical protein [Casimicrobiaceae bacterium]
MVQFHTSHLGQSSPEGIRNYGNPEQFFGIALVGFIDLLGFSTSIRRDWKSAVETLLRIKEGAQKWQTLIHIQVTHQASPSAPYTIYQSYRSRIHTVSDSIVITSALENPTAHRDLALSIKTLFRGVGWIWERAVDAGFSIRGALEVGQIYWTPSETIGPAFLDCYEYESQLADWSRVLVGPRLLETIGQFPPTDEPLTSFLTLSQDGLVEAAPTRFGYEQRRIQIENIRANAGPIHWEKYDPLLAHLTQGWRPVTTPDLIRARSEIVKRIERKRKLPPRES